MRRPPSARTIHAQHEDTGLPSPAGSRSDGDLVSKTVRASVIETASNPRVWWISPYMPHHEAMDKIPVGTGVGNRRCVGVCPLPDSAPWDRAPPACPEGDFQGEKPGQSPPQTASISKLPRKG